MARFRLEPGPIPLHHQVYLDLRAALDEGEWRSGDRLPSERELASRYGCSLITVRRALDELAREHRLTRTQGRGTFAARPAIERDLLGTGSFTEEMRARGLEPQTRVVTARQQPSSEKVAAALELGLGAPIVYLERLRIAAGEPLLLEQVHLPAERFPGLLDEDLEHNSLYEVLATRYGTAVARTRETIEPVLLRAREAKLLEHDPHRPALLLEGTAYTAADEPVEYTETFVPGDRTKFRIDTVPIREATRMRQLELIKSASGLR